MSSQRAARAIEPVHGNHSCAASAAKSLIRLVGVSKTYGVHGSAVIALQNIDLEILAGEFVAVVGPSGCGKSTLLRILAGLIPASSGKV